MGEARIGLVGSKRMGKQRQYVRDNRALWKQMGFRMMSTPVHDEDREEVLAELAVKRCIRMCKMASDKATGIATLVQLGRRNLTPPTPPKEMKELKQLHQRKDNFVDIEYALDKSKEAYGAFRSCQANLHQVTDEHAKQRLYAKEVAYGNLAAAWFALAKVRIDKGVSTVDTVFDAKDTTGGE